jgi:FMN phosphatase YigB (HAD superfamily)
MERLHLGIVQAGYSCALETVQAAFMQTVRAVGEQNKETLVDIGPRGRWELLCAELDATADRLPYAVVEQAYRDLTLSPPAELIPHVDVAIRSLRTEGVRLGVICNTGWVGGEVLRDLLAHYDLLDQFDALVFSNEFGVSKPHTSIFEHMLDELGSIPPAQALHVGDLEHSDVAGALAAGMHAALYQSGSGEQVETRAPVVVRDWRDFPQQVRRLSLT